MSIRVYALGALLVFFSGSAAAAGCKVPEQIRQAQANSITRAVLAVLASAPDKGVDCGSVASVWVKLSERARDGGRRLAGPTRPDPAQARAQWEEAQRDPQIGARLAALRASTSDAFELALLQAAVLDEENLFLARDWCLQQAARPVDADVK